MLCATFPFSSTIISKITVASIPAFCAISGYLGMTGRIIFAAWVNSVMSFTGDVSCVCGFFFITGDDVFSFFGIIFFSCFWACFFLVFWIFFGGLGSIFFFVVCGVKNGWLFS